jgi:Amt family ammonium transporter
MKLFDFCISAIMFYVCGYAISTSADFGIIGNGKFFTIGFDNIDYLDWFLKYSQCCVCVTLVSRSLAERTYIYSYMIFVGIMSSIIFPIANSWVNGNGWLNKLGYHDAAGSSYIHMVGGICGLVGNICLGPRIGIFD